MKFCISVFLAFSLQYAQASELDGEVALTKVEEGDSARTLVIRVSDDGVVEGLIVDKRLPANDSMIPEIAALEFTPMSIDADLIGQAAGSETDLLSSTSAWQVRVRARPQIRYARPYHGPRPYYGPRPLLRPRPRYARIVPVYPQRPVVARPLPPRPLLVGPRPLIVPRWVANRPPVHYEETDFSFTSYFRVRAGAHAYAYFAYPTLATNHGVKKFFEYIDRSGY